MPAETTVEYIYEARCARYEVTARSTKSEVIFQVKEVVAWQGTDFKPTQLEPVLSALIKRDGCSHWTYEDSLHLEAAEEIRRHGKLHNDLYLIACRLMGVDPEDEERLLARLSPHDRRRPPGRQHAADEIEHAEDACGGESAS